MVAVVFKLRLRILFMALCPRPSQNFSSLMKNNNTIAIFGLHRPRQASKDDFVTLFNSKHLSSITSASNIARDR